MRESRHPVCDATLPESTALLRPEPMQDRCPSGMEVEMRDEGGAQLGTGMFRPPTSFRPYFFHRPCVEFLCDFVKLLSEVPQQFCDFLYVKVLWQFVDRSVKVPLCESFAAKAWSQ